MLRVAGARGGEAERCAQRTSRREEWWRKPPGRSPPSCAIPARTRDAGERALPMHPLPARVHCHGPSAHVGTRPHAIGVSIALVAPVAAGSFKAD